MKTKEHNQTKLIIRSSLALALVLAIWFPVQARSAEPGESEMMEDCKAEDCKAMMAQKQKMKEDMKAQVAELTEHVAKMNAAPEDKKMDLLAAVVTHMVEQRIAMDARKAKMQEEMMKHMMKHMQAGKKSMAQCPMMKGPMMKGPKMKVMKDMKHMDDKSEDAHKGHKEDKEHKGHKEQK